MDIKVLDTSHGPVYEQIRSQIESMITSGMLVQGMELPRLTALAQQCGADKGEVARAYFELEQAGLVHSKKSRNFLGETVITHTVA